MNVRHMLNMLNQAYHLIHGSNFPSLLIAVFLQIAVL